MFPSKMLMRRLRRPSPRPIAHSGARPQDGRLHVSRAAQFQEIRALYESGSTVSEISRKLSLGLRQVQRWVCRIDFPERKVMSPKPSAPSYFGTFLAASWAKGTTNARHLSTDIRCRGYTGSFSHPARFAAPWREPSVTIGGNHQHPPDAEASAPPILRAIDQITGRQLSSITAAALCMKPRSQMTER
jgi:hypothetical protein